MANATKFKSKRIHTVCNVLFTDGDILYIVSPNGKQSLRLSVYDENKKLIGTISDDRYWDLIKILEEQ